MVLDSLSGLNYHQAPSCTSFSNVTFTNLHDYIDIIYFHMCEIMYTPAPCLYYLPWLCLWNFLSQAQPKQCSVLKKNAVYLSLWSHNPWSISWGTFYCKEGKLWNLQSQVKNDTMWSFSKKLLRIWRQQQQSIQLNARSFKAWAPGPLIVNWFVSLFFY